jgi:hypothetical protein
MKTIYQGSVRVPAADYTHPARNADGEYEQAEIAFLDEFVTRRSRLDFVLDYPFERLYEGHVMGDAGITLRQVIDAIRKGFRVMYRGAAQTDIPGIMNKLVDGDYGRAVHAIDDLVIERIVLDDATGQLQIMIGS